MATSVVNFGQSWMRAVAGVKKRTEKTMRSGLSELFVNIIASTPVDTGRLVTNWQTSLDSPKSDYLEDEADPTGGQATANVFLTMAQYKLGDRVYFSNNAPYASLIEYGRSTQKAPAGMVRINLEHFTEILDRWAQTNK